MTGVASQRPIGCQAITRSPKVHGDETATPGAPSPPCSPSGPTWDAHDTARPCVEAKYRYTVTPLAQGWLWLHAARVGPADASSNLPLPRPTPAHMTPVGGETNGPSSFQRFLTWPPFLAHPMGASHVPHTDASRRRPPVLRMPSRCMHTRLEGVPSIGSPSPNSCVVSYAALQCHPAQSSQAPHKERGPGSDYLDGQQHSARPTQSANGF